jgi:RNA polymerase sigma factor (sigma-70 family)
VPGPYSNYRMNPDPKLIKACIQGDERAFRALFSCCYSLMMAICVRYLGNPDDARGVVNQAFYKIVKNLKTWDEDRSFEAWAKKITVNTAIDECRKNQQHKKHMPLTPIDDVHEVWMPISVNDAEYSLSVEALETMIRELPELHRRVFNLHAIDGYSHAEIADVLDCSVSASKWYLHQARKILKEKLENIFSEEKKINHG